MRFLKRNHASSQKRRCPNNFAEKQRKLFKNGTFFGFLVGASPCLGWGDVFPQGIDRSTQNYKDGPNVDYDFAIKHDLTLWFDQVMGVWSWVSKKGKKAWSYLNQLVTGGVLAVAMTIEPVVLGVCLCGLSLLVPLVILVASLVILLGISSSSGPLGGCPI